MLFCNIQSIHYFNKWEHFGLIKITDKNQSVMKMCSHYQSLCHSFQHISAHNLEACQSLSGVSFVTPEEEITAEMTRRCNGGQTALSACLSLGIWTQCKSVQVGVRCTQEFQQDPQAELFLAQFTLSLVPTVGWSVFQNQPVTVFQIRLYFAFLCVSGFLGARFPS